jgi:NodT family efflux transporter outer membrane factor (OMF) lipoprotein
MSRRADSGRRLGAVCVLAASCAVGPNYVRPAAPKTTRYTAATSSPAPVAPSKSGVQHVTESNKLAADWWRLLGSRELDAIVADALLNNPTLEAAEASLRRSQDTLRAGYGVFFPAVDAGAGAARQRYSPQRVGSGLPPSVFNLFTLSASVSYALDVWGGQRRAVEGLRAQLDAQRYTVVGATLMLSGNVVNTIVAAAAYRAELEATKEIIALEDEQVRLGEAQAQAGTIPYANVLSLRSQAASTRATVPALEEKIDQAEHLIATLTGRTPAEWTPPQIALDELALPSEVPLSLPAELVRQRPDILVAEAQLHVATSQIGVATAAMLPSLTLTGSIGANNTTATNLFSSGSLFWNMAAGLTQPIFRGGALWYERKSAMDARDEALATYRQAVLSAFAQIADSLRAIAHDTDALDAETEALDAAESAFHLVQINYDSGLANYLQVLTADAQFLQSRLDFVRAKAQRIQDTVALFVALGGGWWNAQPVTMK